jgi:hypothetical protein
MLMFPLVIYLPTHGVLARFFPSAQGIADEQIVALRYCSTLDLQPFDRRIFN